MRVALIGRYRVPYPFSEHRLDYFMLKAWAEQMEQLYVIVQGSQKKPCIWQDGNLSVYYAPSLFLAQSPLVFVIWATHKLIEINRRAHIDVINGSDLWGGLIGILLRPLIRVKVLAQLQSEFLPPSRVLYSVVHRHLIHMIARFVCRRADLVRCLYQKAAQQVSSLGVPKSKIAVVPSRCDVDLFDPNRFPPKENAGQHLLYIGNLILGKGIHFLLEALPDVVCQYPNITLTIVGSGRYEGELRILVNKLGLSSRVVFLGRRPHDELPSILHKSDVFVFPSLSEGTPRAIMEAMAMELPVIATKVGGITEVIEEGRTGLIVEPGNSKQLATAIRWVLDNSAWGKEGGRFGRQRILTYYTEEQHVQRMVALHHRLLS